MKRWALVQEHDLKLSGEDISDIPVVVGLVAAALLLLTLYSGPAAEEPSASAAAPGASPADPSKHAGLERQQLQAARLQPAARQQQQQAAVEGGLPRPGSLAPNRDSSTSLNHWLGMERAGHVRPPLKAVLEVGGCPQCCRTACMQSASSSPIDRGGGTLGRPACASHAAGRCLHGRGSRGGCRWPCWWSSRAS